MRKFFCAAIVPCCLFFLCACQKTQDMGTLFQISRPYAGEYVCEQLSIGGEDCLDSFEFIKLKLGYGGDFSLFYQTKGGGEGRYKGKYFISPQGDEITFTVNTGLNSVSQTFPYEKGAVLFDWNLGGKLLHAEFRFP